MNFLWLVLALIVPQSFQMKIEEWKLEEKNYVTLQNYMNIIRRVIEEEQEFNSNGKWLDDTSFAQLRQKRSLYGGLHPHHFEKFPPQVQSNDYGGYNPDLGYSHPRDFAEGNAFVDAILPDTRLEIQLIEVDGQKQILLSPAQFDQDPNLNPLNLEENLSDHHERPQSYDSHELPHVNYMEHQPPEIDDGYHYQPEEDSIPLSNVEIIPLIPYDRESGYYSKENVSSKGNVSTFFEVSYDSETVMPNSTLEFDLAVTDVTENFTDHLYNFTSQESVPTQSSIPYANHINLDNEDEVIGSGSMKTDYPFEGSGELDPRNINETYSDEKSEKNGRFIELFSDANDTLSPCTTPKNESGYCRHFRHCLLHEVLNNFNSFLQYTCLMKSRFVGICCPINPVVEVTNPDEQNSTSSSTEEVLPIQPSDGCGVNSKTRIVGGTISKPHEWTWMVALLRRNRFFCGGVLINNKYVLTAAHCILGMNIKDLTVRLGEYNLNNKTEQQQDIGISEIKRHAQFSTFTFQHDIALLKLRREVLFTRFVGTICLPQNNDFTDVNATVVGWGTMSFGGAASPILRQATIPVLRNSDCDRIYSLENIDESFMCAGSPDDEQDACQGDSGGPLMNINDAGRWQVIGLVSWGRKCGDPDFPGVYTRVTSYLDWIKANIR